MIRVAFCCHGNICRSTLAQSVFTYKVKELGLEEQFVIDSFATSTEEIGNPPHRGTVQILQEVGIPVVPHRAKQITIKDYHSFDYVIAMDDANIRNLNRMLKGDPDNKVTLLLDYTDRKGASIADPWYTGNFTATYRDVVDGLDGFMKYLGLS